MDSSFEKGDKLFYRSLKIFKHFVWESKQFDILVQFFMIKHLKQKKIKNSAILFQWERFFDLKVTVSLLALLKDAVLEIMLMFP